MVAHHDGRWPCVICLVQYAFMNDITQERTYKKVRYAWLSSVQSDIA